MFQWNIVRSAGSCALSHGLLSTGSQEIDLNESGHKARENLNSVYVQIITN